MFEFSLFKVFMEDGNQKKKKKETNYVTLG